MILWGEHPISDAEDEVYSRRHELQKNQPLRRQNLEDL